MNDNDIAIVALCSGLLKDESYSKTYTPVAWSRLVKKIIKSEIKEPKNLSKYSKDDLVKILEISEEEATSIFKLLNKSINLAIRLEKLNNEGIHILTKASPQYPVFFREKLKQKAPPVLFYSGNIALLSQKGIAIVGSRSPYDKEIEVTKSLVDKALSDEMVVISGGAKGIDLITEQRTLEGDGNMIAIVSNGLSKKIKQKSVRDSILKNKMLVLSDVQPNAPFNIGFAMNRNKYIYALAEQAFVIASDYDKGGTWTGAVENMKERWTPLFTYSNTKRIGNKELIKLGSNTFNEKNIKDHDFKSSIKVLMEEQQSLFK